MPQTEIFSFNLEIGIECVFSKIVSLKKNTIFLNIYLNYTEYVPKGYLALNNLDFG